MTSRLVNRLDNKVYSRSLAMILFPPPVKIGIESFSVGCSYSYSFRNTICCDLRSAS